MTDKPLRRIGPASQLLVLVVVWACLNPVSSLSITPNGNKQTTTHSQPAGSAKPANSSTNTGKTAGTQHHHHQQQQHNQHQVQPVSITTLPPLITTISQNNYLDSVLELHQRQKQEHQQHQQQQQPQAQQRYNDVSANENTKHQALGEQRSNTADDDSVPLATINNHSRNNQPVARPPQYVDVSTLVGQRERVNGNSTSSLGMASAASVPSPSLVGPAAAASALTGKSRSGLPECATQQVCNAIFVRMNYTQKLCECSQNYNWRCSNNPDPQDGHTIELTRKFDKRIYTQIKTCEPLREVRACKTPTDWTLLALQSERTGKAHYVVVCKCPTWAQLEGPYTHNHPPYANIPGIRVYGMLCAHQTARSSAQTYATYNPALNIYPEFPWQEALNVLNTTNLASTLNSH